MLCYEIFPIQFSGTPRTVRKMDNKVSASLRFRSSVFYRLIAAITYLSLSRYPLTHKRQSACRVIREFRSRTSTSLSRSRSTTLCQPWPHSREFEGKLHEGKPSTTLPRNFTRLPKMGEKKGIQIDSKLKGRGTLLRAHDGAPSNCETSKCWNIDEFLSFRGEHSSGAIFMEIQSCWRKNSRAGMTFRRVGS